MIAAPPLALPSYFVAAMRANPADDGLRLQVADWFDENGQPERAEFVRVSIELSRLDPNPGPNRYGNWADLRRRWRDLFDAAAGPLTDPTFTSPYLTFDRGFVSKVECPAAAWLHAGDAIYAREPVVAVTLTSPLGVKFGNITRSTDTVDDMVILRASWLALADSPARVMGRTVSIRRGEHPEEQAYRRAEFDRRVEQDRTDEGYARGRWPGVAFTLPDLRAGMFMGTVEAEGEAEATPPDHGTTDWDVAENLSAAPPDSARRRGGHFRMPGWLAEQRNRPGRRR